MLTTHQKKQLINTFVGNHDLICQCHNPAVHCLNILIDQLKPELQPQEIKQIKQCLGDAPTTPEEDDTGIDGVDLEKLFGNQEEDDGEDDDTR